MASSAPRKLCTGGNGCKQPAATNCEGCSQALCTKHFIEHRSLLSEEMDIIIGEHDQFQHTLQQQTTNSNSYPLIKQIDEWEKESILKIQHKANELRSELAQLAIVHFNELSKKIRHLSEKLKDAREHDSFVETDLREWKISLDDLTANLASPSVCSISQDDAVPLVQNIFVNSNTTNELFERVFDTNVRIEHNGQVAIHNALTSQTEIRGKLEYMSSCHKIRLSIEQSINECMFLGINSKSTPLQKMSYSSISAYGWSNNNFCWLNGSAQQNTSAPQIQMKANDVISLIFDCNNHKISMVNERNNAKYELVVNTDYCPLPWQLHVSLYEPHSRVRILPTSP